MTSSDKKVVVIDNGSYVLKGGIGGDETPKSVFRNVVGSDGSLGNKAIEKEVALHSPLKKGVITNWEEMEKIWRLLFDELKVKPEESPVLLTERAKNPKQNREKVTTVMFETFKVPALYIEIQAILSVYSSGRPIGVALDCGADFASIVPVVENYEGIKLPHSVVRLDIGGRDLTELLRKGLWDRGITYFRGPAQLDTVRDIKEKLGYVALDFDQELKTAQTSAKIDKNYELPDKSVVVVGAERFKCAEALFKPILVGYEESGIDEKILQSVLAVDERYRPDLYSNVVLSGGSTSFPGLVERLQKELAALAPSALKARVTRLPEPQYAVWIGGSMLTALPSFESRMITKKEYDENGPDIVNKKCPSPY